MPADTLMEKLAEFTFVDGYNENYSQYLSSQYLNTRYAYAIGLPEVYEIDYIKSDGNLANGLIQPIAWNETVNEKTSKDEQNKYSFIINDSTAFLTINSFSIDSKSFQKFLKKSFAKIRDIDIKFLVIDMRDNRGGSQKAANELLGYFIKETVRPIKEKYAVVDKLPYQEYFIKDNSFNYFHKEKLKKSEGKYVGVSDAEIKVSPKRKPFMGNLIFLINENCASATTSFLGQIKTHRTDALFIGRETLGNPAIVVADYIVSLVLPNSNIIVKIPLISSEKNVSFDNPKRGVVPDIEVTLSIEEIKLKSDKIMKRAKEEIIEIKRTGHKKG
jgi:C-terminal processing protease CtpA/Prc